MEIIDYIREAIVTEEASQGNTRDAEHKRDLQHQATFTALIAIAQELRVLNESLHTTLSGESIADILFALPHR